MTPELGNVEAAFERDIGGLDGALDHREGLVEAGRALARRIDRADARGEAYEVVAATHALTKIYDQLVPDGAGDPFDDLPGAEIRDTPQS